MHSPTSIEVRAAKSRLDHFHKLMNDFDCVYEWYSTGKLVGSFTSARGLAESMNRTSILVALLSSPLPGRRMPFLSSREKVPTFDRDRRSSLNNNNNHAHLFDQHTCDHWFSSCWCGACIAP